MRDDEGKGGPKGGFFSRLSFGFGLQKSSAIVLAAVVTLYVLFDAVLFTIHTPGSDWAPLWVGGRLSWTTASLAYDVELVSSLQAPLMGPTSDRPFVYPPSALLLFAPFAGLPFSVSFVLFGMVSVFLFVQAARPFDSCPILLLAAPPVVLAVLAGQPSILVVALIMMGLVHLDRNGILAGVLFTIAAMIKPTLLLLAPVALIAGGYWRAIFAAGASACTIGVLSLAIFGLDAWHAWFSALPEFQSLVTGFEPLLRNAVTPNAMAVRIGLPTQPVTVLAALIAIPIAWIAFAKTNDLGLRLVALVGGALLVSPYAMNYELAAFAPVVAAWRLEKLKAVILQLIWAGSIFVTASFAGLIAIYIWAFAHLASHVRRTHWGRAGAPHETR